MTENYDEAFARALLRRALGLPALVRGGPPDLWQREYALGSSRGMYRRFISAHDLKRAEASVAWAWAGE